ncbi:uncharacterized protein [Prorops nasuta]|uniref:uncharacterized protein n=1 Tax=Prorops nasuta TaxID=863751 RepID=UPI0034CED394
MKFFVVQFKDGLGIVPESWLFDDNKMSFYPTCSKQKLNAAIQKEVTPNINDHSMKWQMFDIIRIFGSAESFERALIKLEMAETYSDINTEDEATQKSTRHERAKRVFSSSDEETEKESYLKLPPLPKVKKLKRVEPEVLASFECPIIEPTNILPSTSSCNNVPLTSSAELVMTESSMKGHILEKDYSSRIFKKLNKISYELIDVSRQLDRMERRLDLIENFKIPQQMEQQAADVIDNNLLPLENVDGFMEFEENLRNKEFSLRVVIHF